MKELFQALSKDKRLLKAKEQLKNGLDTEFDGCIDIQKSILISLLSDRQSLVVTSSENSAYQMYENLRYSFENISYFPTKDLFVENLSIKSGPNDNLRLKALSDLAQKKDIILITSFHALADKFPDIQDFVAKDLIIKYDDNIDRDEVEQRLEILGYERTTVTEIPNQYSIRGSLIDIFSPNYEKPIRIDTWGDEISRMCFFDEDSQISIEDVKEVRIIPTGEFSVSSEMDRVCSLIRYFDDNFCIFIDEPDRVFDEIKSFYSQINLLKNDYDIFDEETLRQSIMSNKKCCLSLLNQSVIDVPDECKYEIPCMKLSGFKAKISEFFPALDEYLKAEKSVAVLINNEKKAKRLADDANEYGVNAYFTNDNTKPPKPGQVVFYKAYLSEGIEYKDISLVLISDNDIFGKRPPAKKQSKYKGGLIGSFFDLKPGDLVVHEDYGLGRYLGTQEMKTDGSMKDYLKIEYYGDSYLYIPVAQMDRVQKYISKENEGKAIRLSNLGTNEWSNTKKKVQASVAEAAVKLMELYAQRHERTGYAFSEDTVWQREFEDSFIYEETPAQLEAIEAVKKDMQSPKVMDRLICGDVGFGKTEIAIRAAFKAVQDGKQVAYLVPTTVLAMQHYNTFAQRLSGYPVNVDLLCRFRTSSMQKKTINGLKDGSVDIVIGTHRLLSQDVDFNDLGLLIVDEEQRFGVSAKEKIKDLKKDIDVLTLTATPIPRTLHMSMIGVRDISILNAPPSNRLPINTYATAYNDELVVEAIRRELSRGGQVFFVYNRVRTIEDITLKLEKLMPDIQIAYAHGQMPSKELEKIIYDFSNGEIDVLVSTTIIETGIDMPNVNTMIIADAQRLGLSSLYQLRGRIGRSDKTAYAYLLYPSNVLLKEEAQKRLHAIREFSQLGSGYKIAMRDLEIRGEGNIFGFEQSGHIGAVGYELYCKFLRNAISELKNENEIRASYNTAIEVPINAYLPSEYIEDERSRMELYKKIALIEDDADRQKIADELVDRFGKIPKVVNALLDVAMLRSMASKACITDIKLNANSLDFYMYDKAKLDMDKIADFVFEYNLSVARLKDPENKRLFTDNVKNYRHKYYGLLSCSIRKSVCFVHKLLDEMSNQNALLEIIKKVIDGLHSVVIE